MNASTAEPQINPEFQTQVNTLLFEWQSGARGYTETLEAMRDMRQRAALDGSLVHEGMVENSLGIVEGYRSNYSKSVVHFEAARRLYETCGATSRIANATLNIGETYRLRGNFQKARACFHDAYDQAQRTDNLAIQAIAVGNEAQIWCSLQHYDSAYDLLIKAEALCQTPWQDPEPERLTRARRGHECEVQHAFVDVYLHRHNIDAAVQHAQRGLELAQMVNEAIVMGMSNRAMAKALTARHAHDPHANPDEYFRAAHTAFESINAEGEIGKTLLAQGKSLAQRGRKRSAAQLFQRAMDIFARAGMTNDAALAAEAQLSVI